MTPAKQEKIAKSQEGKREMTDLGGILYSVISETIARAKRNREKRPETIAEAIEVLEDFLNDYFGSDLSDGVYGKECTAFDILKEAALSRSHP